MKPAATASLLITGVLLSTAIFFMCAYITMWYSNIPERVIAAEVLFNAWGGRLVLMGAFAVLFVTHHALGIVFFVHKQVSRIGLFLTIFLPWISAVLIFILLGFFGFPG
jgi:hypothetical protein